MRNVIRLVSCASHVTRAEGAFVKTALCLFSSFRVVVLDKVTDLLLFFGKLLVVGGVGTNHTGVFRKNLSCFKSNQLCSF